MEHQSKLPLDTDADEGAKSVHTIDQKPAAQVCLRADVYPEQKASHLWARTRKRVPKAAGVDKPAARTDATPKAGGSVKC